MTPRVPVCAYSARQVPVEGQQGPGSDIEVIVCNDGSVWTLVELQETGELQWSQDKVPPIPGSFAALTAALARGSPAVAIPPIP